MSIAEFFIELKEASEDAEKARVKAEAESKRRKHGKR